jgi:hypothetical protein
MCIFKWSQSHINWLITRFKNEERDITAKDVLDNYNRRKGEPKIVAQDCRNLMRLTVQGECARVTNGCVNSNSYRIQLVTSNYPYTQELFDKELFNWYLLGDLPSYLGEVAAPFYMDDEMNVTDEIPQKMIFESYELAKLYQRAFLTYNFSGGDIDNVFLEEGVFIDEMKTKELISQIINRYTQEYKLWKIVGEVISESTREEVPTVMALLFFSESFQNSIAAQLLTWMENEARNYQPSSKTIAKRRRKLIERKHLGEVIDEQQIYSTFAFHRMFQELPFLRSDMRLQEAFFNFEMACMEVPMALEQSPFNEVED